MGRESLLFIGFNFKAFLHFFFFNFFVDIIYYELFNKKKKTNFVKIVLDTLSNRNSHKKKKL